MSSQIEQDARQRLIFAVDVPDLDEARSLATRLTGRVGMFKIGLELFTAVGPDAVRAVRDQGGQVFLDLKLHDIPATVARAAAAAASLGVHMLTVHAAGGARMMAAAYQGAHEGAQAADVEPPIVIGVTALTSLSGRDLAQVGMGEDVVAVVDRLARLVNTAGLDGVVASPQEVEHLRGVLGAESRIVTPGVRPDWDELAARRSDDQSRVATPHAAILAGADYLVVGRPIRESDDPGAAADRVVAEIATALQERQRATRAQTS